MYSTVRYATILDAGSSSTRIFVYKWDTAGGANGFQAPLKIERVFPLPSENDVESRPGIHNYDKAGSTMAAYLDPLLFQASSFLANQADRNGQLVPIYLLATGGMRGAFRDDEERRQRNRILKLAWARMGSIPHFNAGDPSNARVITGQTEGLLAWVANNYAQKENDTTGIFEIGGSSAQVSFLERDTNFTKRICLFSNPYGYDVYSRSWNGLGINAAGENLKAKFIKLKSEPPLLENPCLPKFYRNAIEGMVGTGNFSHCMEKAGQVLAPQAQQIPKYIEGTPIVGLSVPMYSYDFFSELRDIPGFKLDMPYDYELYRAAIEDYCEDTATVPDGRPVQITLDTCFAAAWTLTLLHSDAGLAMPTDKTRGTLTFPNKKDPDLKLRSSWTLGAAALVARHDDLMGCPRGIEPLSAVPLDDSTRLGEDDWPPIFLPSDSVNPSFYDVSTISESSTKSTNVGIADWNDLTFVQSPTISCIAAFSIILIAMVAFLYHRRCALAAAGKIALLSDIKGSTV